MAEVMNLPVLAYREQIVESVRTNSAVVITAETGAGKSTQVPRFLAEAGFRVVVTQPRRLAARTLAQRVAMEMKTRLGDRVGFRTADERSDSAATEVLFVTDGLQLVRELAGQGGTGRKTVLVLDEVHEWNLNVETLVAWARQRVSAEDDFRVVLMSATLDAERLANFFGGAPVISVPGRLFPVERREAPAKNLVTEIVGLAKAGRNVLVFQPGKREIAETISAVERELGSSALVLPLHGDLSPEEQQRCFAPPPAGKTKVVVSTNVAQTSVTIPDIDAVVDSGVERRVEMADGIEGLYLKAISQADASQRAGRAGRVKPGVYVLCSETSMTERPSFPRAEILRSRLDQLVLRLAVQGFDATVLKFFHQPDAAVLVEARRSLEALGAMSSDGSVTKIGRRMARMPVAVQYARMLVEAESRGVLEQVATIASCLEAGEIRGKDGEWKSLTKEKKSDLLAVLDVYDAARQIKGGGDALRSAGIFAKDFFRAGEIRRKLVDAVRDSVRSDSRKFASKEEEREQVLRACVAGLVDHLYQGGNGVYRNGDRVERQLARESVVSGGEWLVGLPKDIEIQGKRGKMLLRLVSMASAVNPTWLLEVAPQLGREETGIDPAYDPEKDCVVAKTHIFFNDRKVGEKIVKSSEHPQAAAVFARWLASGRHLPEQRLVAVLRANAARQEQARRLNIRTDSKLFEVLNQSGLENWYLHQSGGARCVREVPSFSALALPPLDEELVATVARECPDTISVLGTDLRVDYEIYGYSRTNPGIKLTEEMVKGNAWTQLPDEGIKLPGGRKVEVEASFGWRATVTETNIPRLKAKMREHLDQELWNLWEKPSVLLPDLEADEPVVPEIVEVCYGISMVDGAPLTAFGVPSVKGGRYYSSDPWFEGSWYRSRAQAEAARLGSVQKLEEIRKEIQEKKALEILQKEVEGLAQEVNAVRSRQGFNSIGYDLRSNLEGRRLGRSSSSVEELTRWIEETRASIAEVESAIVEIARRQEEEEAAKVRRQSIEIAISSFGWPKAHLLVTGQEVFVQCAESGQVTPVSGEARCMSTSIDARGKTDMWWPVRIGQRVTLREFSWKGNLKREDTIKRVPAGLTPGVWGVGEDDDGEFFFKVIYFEGGREIIPEEVVCRRASELKAPVSQPVIVGNTNPVDLSKVDLGALFGGNIKKR